MEVPKYCYRLLVLLFVLVPYVASDETNCGPAKTLGVTFPPGDINIQREEPLEIYCTLKIQPPRLHPDVIPKHYNASDIFFVVDGEEIPKDYIYIVNETTVKLRVDKPPSWKSMSQCAVRLEDNSSRLVCLNYVMVGEKPQKLSNFSCISHNWESMNCSWIRQPNNVPTNYTVSYALNKHNKRYGCPDSTIDRDYCVWNASSTPPYRLPYASYSFFIQGQNVFGEIKQNITIDHYASVIPSKPVNLSLVGSTSESLKITWTVPVAIKNFPPGLRHKIMYQSKFDPIGAWQTVMPKLSDTKFGVFEYNITGLKYAGTLYDVRVLLKSALADDGKWSEPATITIHTNSTVPGSPPKTCPGAFEIRSTSTTYRDIYIYWQQIPNYLENGDNFEYKIVKVVMHGDHGPMTINPSPTLVTKTYALFSNLLSYRYDFSIVSSNIIGYSESSSTITVPSKENGLPEPSDFVKSSYEGGIWEINWKVDPSISSYTIFWCDNKQDRPYECQGFLNWTHVVIGEDTKEDTAAINITLPDKLYQIALSANTNYSSSGMVWASCTLLSGNVYSKLKDFEIFPGSDFIDVNWTFDCVKPTKTNGRGFQLHYCPIKDPEKKNLTCKEREIVIPINPGNDHVRIKGLKPYTTYSVYFARTGKMKIPLKEPLLGTTLEAAPDQPPQNLKAVQVTNTSITLSWKPPPSINGILKNYFIYWNNNFTIVTDKSPTVQVTLTNLRSYCEYSIKVQACTTNCSANSTVLDIKTGIGIPGIVESSPTVKLKPLNDTNFSMEATWNAPREPGGPIKYYDVRVKLSDGSSIQKETLYKSRNTSLQMPARECPDIGGAKYYKVQVRAVNSDEDGNKLSGPWSPEGEGNCVPILPNLALMVFVSAVGILALLAICISVVYVIRCLWLRCKAMQNVSVKLPPQLELNNVFQSKNKGAMDQLASHTIPSQLKQVDIKDTSPPDQQLLLDQKDKEESLESSPEDCEEAHGDQESSGCGSGHDSVSSSITAGTHITDSGTEADERPSTPDVFGENPRRKEESRQRNVSMSGSNGEGYSRLAAAPTSNGGYVTVAPASRGYVSHPPLWSSQNQPKGYVTVGPPVNVNSTCG
uniref:Cytokine receptor n=2 Tax=Lygus hesperus TaxID=30085 RepID=A0A0A9YSC8_LYGHE